MSSLASHPKRADEIGEQIRVMYEKVLREPVPERFSELLKALEAGTTLPIARPKNFQNEVASIKVA